jgi:murein DD-endopeptidase MepM/ murein hydrolase activator NlpD
LPELNLLPDSFQFLLRSKALFEHEDQLRASIIIEDFGKQTFPRVGGLPQKQGVRVAFGEGQDAVFELLKGQMALRVGVLALEPEAEVFRVKVAAFKYIAEALLQLGVRHTVVAQRCLVLIKNPEGIEHSEISLRAQCNLGLFNLFQAHGHLLQLLGQNLKPFPAFPLGHDRPLQLGKVKFSLGHLLGQWVAQVVLIPVNPDDRTSKVWMPRDVALRFGLLLPDRDGGCEGHFLVGLRGHQRCLLLLEDGL